MNQKAKEKLCFTEIMNDLYTNGFRRDGKANAMLRDYCRELRERADFPASRQRKVFNHEVGKGYYYDSI